MCKKKWVNLWFFNIFYFDFKNNFPEFFEISYVREKCSFNNSFKISTFRSIFVFLI